MFNNALELYRSIMWDEAAKAFARVLKSAPRFRVANVYVKRCKHLKANPPGKHWDGVFIMEGK